MLSHQLQMQPVMPTWASPPPEVVIQGLQKKQPTWFKHEQEERTVERCSQDCNDAHRALAKGSQPMCGLHGPRSHPSLTQTDRSFGQGVYAMCATGTMSLRLWGFHQTLQSLCSQSKVTPIRLIWNAKLTVGANASADGCCLWVECVTTSNNLATQKVLLLTVPWHCFTVYPANQIKNFQLHPAVSRHTHMVLLDLS